MPWEVWKRTGNANAVHDAYEAARMFVEFLDRNAANRSAACPHCGTTAPLYTRAVYGDWVCCAMIPQCGDWSGPAYSCNAKCPHASASAFAHVLATLRLVDMATVVGNAADVAHYTARLPLLRAAYHRLFFDPTQQRYGEAGSAPAVQSHQVFPLYLGVVPTEHQAAVVAALIESVANQSYHPNTGIIGARFLLETLTRYGHADVALKLATNPSCPGWAYMVEQAPGDPPSHEVPGTIWENWMDLHGSGTSKNHPAFSGGVGLWLYQLAGLSEDSHPVAGLVLRPPPEAAAAVGSASLVHRTPAGLVRFAWRVGDGSAVRAFEANLTLPALLPAAVTVHIPILPVGGARWHTSVAAAAAAASKIVLRERGGGGVVWPQVAAIATTAPRVGIESVALDVGRGALVLRLTGSGQYSFLLSDEPGST